MITSAVPFWLVLRTYEPIFTLMTKVALLILLSTFSAFAENPISVDLDPGTKHEVGGFSTFDRRKFITIHSTHTEPDWRGEEEKMNYLIKDLDTYFGRESGAISWQLRLLREDPNHPGHVDFADMKRRSNYERDQYRKQKNLHAFEDHNDLVICAQTEPFWPGSAKITPQDGSAPWSLANPAATAQYMVYWLNMYTGGNGSTRPRFMEIMNEPLYEFEKSHLKISPQEVFDYHKNVATNIRKLNKEVLLGGFTCAFPDPDKNNFNQWEERWKAFIDTAGAEMDFYSFHLYDFPGIHHGKKEYRKGAHLEATFDLLEHYSFLKLGKTKPFVISEYGSQLHDWYNQPWSPYRDWLCLKAINSMLVQFAAKPDRIFKTIPFITAKAEWGHNYGNSGQPYYWRLMRRENEPDSNTGDWVFTDQIKFYELWAGVKGERRLINSSDPNLLVDAYLDGNQASLIFNNLTLDPKHLDLNLTGGEIKKIISKHLYLHENKPRLDWLELPGDTSKFVLGSEAAIVLHLTLADPVPATQTAREQKPYANACVQPILADKPLTFTIPASELSKGQATLRLGFGRDHGLSLKPAVTCNGQSLSIPAPIGPSQKDRANFFGILEINVPLSALKKQNEIKVTFPDTGGHLSSLALESVSIEKQD
ncbi:hypothetical protein N9A86_03495 [Akkermansiaceae bacterium]|nr:hypothetical protein [Akkermansiaceae bacterium]